MDFKKITDDLFARVGHADLAAEIGVSVPTVRQARLSLNAQAHRAPPEGWEKGALKLAEKQARHFERLAARIRASVT